MAMNKTKDLDFVRMGSMKEAKTNVNPYLLWMMSSLENKDRIMEVIFNFNKCYIYRDNEPFYWGMITLIPFLCRRISHKNALKSPWIKFLMVIWMNMNKGYTLNDHRNQMICCFEVRKKIRKYLHEVVIIKHLSR